MVLGYLLYETVDLGINVVKITYNGARGIYYWWYGTDYPEVEREKLAIEDMEIFNKTNRRIGKNIKRKNRIIYFLRRLLLLRFKVLFFSFFFVFTQGSFSSSTLPTSQISPFRTPYIYCFYIF